MWFLNMLKNKFAVLNILMKWNCTYLLPSKTFRDLRDISGINILFILSNGYQVLD